ncbi:MAG TPA: YciI family protein [Pseudonocardiaceae bacterium]|nr:YciI family protein [Pseudonocardiaceae bacterium]
MTQYLLAVHNSGTPPELSREELRQSYLDTDTLTDKMRDAGAFVFAGGMGAIESATVVRHTGGDFLITDGPYTETKEYLGGFWIISAADMDEALDWARQATVACRGPIEIRPFEEPPPLPSE